jgi:tetratricopeptide (TPR) repeat protein
MGEGETALHQLDRSVQLCPTNLWVNWHNTSFVLAHFAAGQYEDALIWTERCLRRWPNHVISLRWKAAILGLLGRTDEAQQVVQHLCELVPGYTISCLRNVWAIVRKQSIRWPAVDAARLEGLRRAGLPE